MSTAIETQPRPSGSTALDQGSSAHRTGRYLHVGLVIALGFSIAWQAAFAGQFLSGQPWALSLHASGAAAVVLLGLATLIVEFVNSRRTSRSGIVWLAGLLLVAILGQYVLGYLSTQNAHFIAYHVPLGVSIAGLYVYYLTVGLRRTPAATRP